MLVMMSRVPLVAVLALLSACAVTRNPATAFTVGEVQEATLRHHVNTLCAFGPRPAGYEEATKKTLEYLETQLRRYGYAPQRESFGCYVRHYVREVDDEGTVTFAMTMKSSVQHNLIAERAGATKDVAVIEIGAHYDTVPWGPGADDNTSGVAALLEAARLLADKPTEKKIRFVFFAMEEEGLIGSREHVKNLVSSGQLPEGILSIDMIGYTSDEPGSQKTPTSIPFLFWPPDVGNFLLVAGDWSSGWLGELFEECIGAYVPELPYYSVNRLAGWFADSTRGDHHNYWQAGIPAIALVDGMDYRNPNYHLQGDTPESLDYTFLRRNCQALVATIFEWAGRTKE